MKRHRMGARGAWAHGLRAPAFALAGVLGLAAAGGCKSGVGATTTAESSSSAASSSSSGGFGIGGQGQGGAPPLSASGMIFGQAFAPVDAVFMDGIEMVDGKQTAALAIYLMDKPGLCASFQAGMIPPSSTMLWFDINASHIAPGTYPLMGAALNPAEAGYLNLGPQCGPEVTAAGTDGGSSLTITEITSTLVAGHYNVSFSGSAVTGTFTASVCKVGFIDPDKVPVMCTVGTGGAGGTGGTGGGP